VLFFDADGLVMRGMNALFALPPVPLAAPRAWWMEQPLMSAQLMLVEPSAARLGEMMEQARRTGAAVLFLRLHGAVHVALLARPLLLEQWHVAILQGPCCWSSVHVTIYCKTPSASAVHVALQDFC
jgi:hypothetical protein